MTEINGYSIWICGNPDGYNDKRAFITLNFNGAQMGYISFHDPGMSFPADHVDPLGRVWMNMPSDMMPNVLDVLRNESPLYIWKPGDCGILTTSLEPSGEND